MGISWWKSKLARDSFTVIADTILLLDDYINLDEEDGLSVFDEETNNYEKSSAKKQVDEWFEQLKRNIER